MKSSLALLAFGALLLACANAPPPPPAITSTTSADVLPASVACEVECGALEIVHDTPRVEQPDYHAAAVADAERVIASMHDDLLACYKKRLATNPRAHGFVTLGIVLEEDGRVRSVTTTGGAMLGDATLKCMASRVMRASFAPVHGGGTLRLEVPLTLRTVSAGESI